MLETRRFFEKLPDRFGLEDGCKRSVRSNLLSTGVSRDRFLDVVDDVVNWVSSERSPSLIWDSERCGCMPVMLELDATKPLCVSGSADGR